MFSCAKGKYLLGTIIIGIALYMTKVLKLSVARYELIFIVMEKVYLECQYDPKMHNWSIRLEYLTNMINECGL